MVPLTEASCIVNRPLASLYATGGLQFSFYSVRSVYNNVLGVRSQGDGGDAAWTRGILWCLKSNVYFIGTFCTSVGSGGWVGFVSKQTSHHVPTHCVKQRKSLHQQTKKVKQKYIQGERIQIFLVKIRGGFPLKQQHLLFASCTHTSTRTKFT